MATINGRQVRDVAKERKENIAKTGGIPKAKVTTKNNDAVSIKIRDTYKKIQD